MSRSTVRSIVVTGANGFIGSRLVARLLHDARFAETRIHLFDRELSGVAADARLRGSEGDLCDTRVLADIAAADPDTVFHLAGILGGAAEADYALARRVNVDSTLSLFETLRAGGRCPRLVFASSIAVFGPPLPATMDDDTAPHPLMTYGAQKLMMEAALAQFSARGWLDGIALRLPGVVARPAADASLKSAFLNSVFHAYAEGRSFTLPVSPTGTTWLISAPACVDAFVHAATLSSELIGQRRAFTLPVLRVAMKDLVAALAKAYPHSTATIGYAPDPSLEAQFTSQPPLRTAVADTLGFRHDGTLDDLVARALAPRSAMPRSTIAVTPSMDTTV